MTNMMHAKLKSIDWSYESRALEKIAEVAQYAVDELIDAVPALGALLTPGQEDEEDSFERDSLEHALLTMVAKAMIGDKNVKED